MQSNRYDALDLNNKIIWNLRDIGHTMRHLYEGKGSQKRILMLLDENGTMTQSDLTQQLEIQPGSASEVLGKLEESGFLVRTPSEADRRTTNIDLTGAGRAAAEWARTLRRERHDQMFACLGEEEKAALLALLEKVNDHWDQQYRKAASRKRG